MPPTRQATTGLARAIASSAESDSPSRMEGARTIVRGLDEGRHVSLEAGEDHAVGEAELRRLRLQLGQEHPRAHHQQPQVAAIPAFAVCEVRHGLQQVAVALLRHQPPHGDEQGRVSGHVPGAAQGGPVVGAGEKLQIPPRYARR